MAKSALDGRPKAHPLCRHSHRWTGADRESATPDQEFRPIKVNGSSSRSTNPRATPARASASLLRRTCRRETAGAITLAPAKADDFYCGARFLIKLPRPPKARRWRLLRVHRTPVSCSPAIHFPQGSHPASKRAQWLVTGRRRAPFMRVGPRGFQAAQRISLVCAPRVRPAPRRRAGSSKLARGRALEGSAHAGRDANGATWKRSPSCLRALRKPTKRWRASRHLYGNSPLDKADVIVALGGDGLMLQTLHT